MIHTISKAKSKKNISLKSTKLPLDVQDFVNFNNLIDWPVCTESQTSFNITKENSVTSNEQILCDLTQKTRSKDVAIESIYKKVDDINAGVESIFHLFFDNNTELKVSTSLDNIEEVAKHNLAVQLNQLNQVKRHERKKRVENYKYPGFDRLKLTELPSLLEVRTILNTVTNSQTFTAKFEKIWKLVFFSQASVALLHDSFWWIFLHKYQTCRDETKDEIFTRMADNYVSIFTSIHSDYKDTFFNEFPRCLAQGVYLVFYLGFPDSREHFTEGFAKEINFKIFGWLTGFTDTTQFQLDWPWDKLLKNLEITESLDSDENSKETQCLQFTSRKLTEKQ